MFDEEGWKTVRPLLLQCDADRERLRREGSPVGGIKAEVIRLDRERMKQRPELGVKFSEELLHHRLSAIGPDCGKCGKPLRTPKAKICAECGEPR